MRFNLGDIVKHREGMAPLPRAQNDTYRVIEIPFLNEAKQSTVGLMKIVTDERVYQDPETIELVR